jgi:sugar phosphate isomerase/epimerase
MVTLSAFADEISPKLEDAVGVLKECGIKHLDLRGFDGVNVLKLSEDQVKYAKGVLKREGVGVAAIASPIGKVDVTDAFEPQAGSMKRALDLARAFDCPHVRVFSFYMPKSSVESGTAHKQWKKEVVDRMGKLVRMAEGTGVKVTLENEEGLYGDTTERAVEIIDAVKSPNLNLAWDPCNLVIIGPKPYTDSFKTAKKHLGYLHVKDWSKERHEIVPAGQGDAEWPAIMKGIRDMKYSGIVSLEPHLSAAGQFSGFTGPDLFRKAFAALAALIKDADLEYN